MSDGDRDELYASVYTELRAIAGRLMARERPDHTLQTTALVHEVYLRLRGREALESADRPLFYAAAAEAMRRILVEHARKRGRIKRGGGRRRLPASVLDLVASEDSSEILAVDEALRRLEGEDPDAAEVVRLRFFAGLSVEETARTLGRSPRTTAREWSYARAWLFRALDQGGSR